MTTLALICVGLLAGYLAGSITGFYIGAEYSEAPIIAPDDTVRPAVIKLPLFDKNTGDTIHCSCFFFSEDLPDGSTKQHIIQNN